MSSQIPPELRYVESHEWCRIEGDVAVIGITDYAQNQLGDVVFIELPEPGTRIDERSRPFGTIESVKAASDLYSPVTGEVLAAHTELEDALEQLNEDPYGEGWLIKVKLADPSELDGLLDAEAYAAHIAAEEA